MEAESSGSTKPKDVEQSVSGKDSRADSYGLDQAMDPGSSGSNQATTTESCGSNQVSDGQR